MSEMIDSVALPRVGLARQIRIQDQWWVLVALAILVTAIVAHQRWYLNFVHVFAGILWTGTDIFMGFVLGPIMKRLDLSTRRALIVGLMPRMIFYMPTVALVTGTSGWFLADLLGYLSMPFPARWWLYGAVSLVAIMTVQGFGILLPTDLKVYWEIQKDQPNWTKVQGWMQRYVKVVAIQGLMQVVIILVMARIVTGF